MNLQKMMQQAQNMQNKLAELQQKLEAEEHEGTSGSGMVKIRITGKNRVLAVSINESLMKADEKDMLEDLLVAAFNDARDKVDTSASGQMQQLQSGLGLPPGIKLPF